MKTTLPPNWPVKLEPLKFEPLGQPEFDKALEEYRELQIRVLLEAFRVPIELIADINAQAITDISVTWCQDFQADYLHPDEPITMPPAWRYQVALGLLLVVIYLIVTLAS